MNAPAKSAILHHYIRTGSVIQTARHVKRHVRTVSLVLKGCGVALKQGRRKNVK